MKLKDLLKEAIGEISYKKAGLQHPDKADLNHDKEISSYEKKRGQAIEKNLEEYNPQDDENNIRFGMEVRPLQIMPSPDNGEIEAMNSNMACEQCGAPMMYEDRMCSECGYMQEEGEQQPNPQAPDHEVFMAKASLKSIISNASELMNKLGDEEIDIPAWVQDHITNADNYIGQANDGYYEYEAGEGNETPDEEALYEAKPSAGLTKKQKSGIEKKAHKGKNVGHGGFDKLASTAAKEYGSKEIGKKVAAAAMWKGIHRK